MPSVRPIADVRGRPARSPHPPGQQLSTGAKRTVRSGSWQSDHSRLSVTGRRTGDALWVQVLSRSNMPVRACVRVRCCRRSGAGAINGWFGRPRSGYLGEAPLELSSARPQLLELLDRAVESVLQIVGEGRQTDDVVECLGRQMRLVSQPTLGGLVLPASGFGWPLAWPTTARPRCLFTLLSDHGRIVAHFRA